MIYLTDNKFDICSFDFLLLHQLKAGQIKFPSYHHFSACYLDFRWLKMMC